MSKQDQATRNTITLKGSTKVVSEFFAYAVNRYAIGNAYRLRFYLSNIYLGDGESAVPGCRVQPGAGPDRTL